MGRDDAIDVAEVLVRRRAFVDRLRERPHEKRELVSALDVSRPTVYRGLRELEEADLVEHDSGRYALTTFGDLVVERFVGFLDSVGSAAEVESFLRWVPPGSLDLDLDPRHLADADVVSASPGDPYAMVNRHVRRLKEADHVRALLPLTGLHAHEAMHDRVVEGDARAELVVASPVVETMRTDPDYRPLTADLAATDRYEVVVVDDLPYYLGVLDDLTQVGVDDDGQPRALLETDDDTVRAWAEETIESYRADAVPVDLTPTPTDIEPDDRTPDGRPPDGTDRSGTDG